VNAGPKAEATGVDVYVSRRIVLPPPGSTICPGMGGTNYCFSLYGVSWRETQVRGRERVMIYRFRAPDAEAVRKVLRRAGIEFDDLWVRRGSGPEPARLAAGRS